MDRLKKIIIVITFVISKSLLFSQTKNNVFAEIINITTNTNTLVSGETLLYKINCVNTKNSKQSDLSKVAFVELISNEKKIVFKHKLFLENGISFNDFFVTSNLKTGNYKLIAFTNWMLNNEFQKATIIDLFIVNPFTQPIDIVFSNNSNTEIINKEIETKKEITLKLNKKLFSCREKVDFDITFLDKKQKGNFSLSVRKKEDLIVNDKQSITGFYNNIKPNDIDLKQNGIKIPDLRGEVISGSISNVSDPTNISNKTIAFSITGKPHDVKLVSTNEKGEFKIVLNNSYQNKNQTLQVLEANRNNFKIKLDDNTNPTFDNLEFKSNITVSEKFKENLEKRSIASQIENAYFTKRADTLKKSTLISNFHSTWDKTYILDNYTRFSSFAETITEIVLEMYYTKNNTNYLVGVRDFNDLYEVDQPALLMIDGLVVQNVNEVFDYKMVNVNKIQIVKGGYYFGNKVFNGVINLETFNNDFKLLETGDYIVNTTIESPVGLKKYFKQDYSDKQKNERIPDYRNQLFWDPNLNINKSVSFYTSDIKGFFKVELQGVLDDGTPVYIKDTFEVK